MFAVKQKYGNKLVQSPIKLKVTLPYVDKANCTKKYAEGDIKLSPSQICAGGKKAKDSCSGELNICDKSDVRLTPPHALRGQRQPFNVSR